MWEIGWVRVGGFWLRLWILVIFVVFGLRVGTAHRFDLSLRESACNTTKSRCSDGEGGIGPGENNELFLNAEM